LEEAEREAYEDEYHYGQPQFAVVRGAIVRRLFPLSSKEGHASFFRWSK
jgi:hypothetical protein